MDDCEGSSVGAADCRVDDVEALVVETMDGRVLDGAARPSLGGRLKSETGDTSCFRNDASEVASDNLWLVDAPEGRRKSTRAFGASAARPLREGSGVCTRAADGVSVSRNEDRTNAREYVPTESTSGMFTSFRAVELPNIERKSLTKAAKKLACSTAFSVCHRYVRVRVMLNSCPYLTNERTQ